MQKQAPTFGRIAAMVAFGLSCFGILIFLWVSFGGPTPLRPQGYRFHAQFAESPLLVQEAEVRMAGLRVGKVKGKELRRQGGTLVTIEMDRDFAPVPSDARAILRQKTLLGQTYIEITPGSEGAPKLPDGGTLVRTRIQEVSDFDEVVRTFDPPTRRAFQGWVRELSKAIKNGRGDDLNTAYGHLDEFAASGADVLAVLDSEKQALRQLIRNASITLGALNEKRGQFGELVVNANDFFGALASRNDALAETIRVLPTFLDESKATFQRLERFANDTRPLVRDLTPVAVQLQPTVRDLGRLAPDLEHLFRSLDPLIDESSRNLPDAARFIRGAKPVFESLHLYLPELNPILAFANYQQQQVADFFSLGGGSLNSTIPGVEGEGLRHVLRQYAIINSRSLGVNRTRPEYDRGNAYPAANYIKRTRYFGIAESFDCKPTATKQEKPQPTNGSPPCFVQPPSLYDGKQFPRLRKGETPRTTPPQGTEGTKPAVAPPN